MCRLAHPWTGEGGGWQIFDCISITDISALTMLSPESIEDGHSNSIGPSHPTPSHRARSVVAANPLHTRWFPSSAAPLHNGCGIILHTL